MGEIRTVTTLETKRLEIRRAINEYERLLAQARADLAHVTAAIHLFDPSDTTASRVPAYAEFHRLYRPRELTALCKRALAEQGPQDTRQLARYALQAKGLNPDDTVLRHKTAKLIICALNQQVKRGGRIADHGKHKGVKVWALPASNDLSQLQPVMAIQGDSHGKT